MTQPDLDAFLAAHPRLDQVELVVTDPGGVARGKWAPVAALKKAFAAGVNFPLSLHGLDVWGSEVPQTGLHIESGDRDGFFRAVPTSLSAVPWGNGPLHNEREATRAQLLLETVDEAGEPFMGCARQVLRSVVHRLAGSGLTPVCAFELEFHLFEADRDAEGLPVPLDDPAVQDMYGLGPLSTHGALFAEIRRAADWAGLPIDTIVKEAGPGQYEVNLSHRPVCEPDNAMRAADDAVLLRRLVRECARMRGLTASFMAKPVADDPGNGMHVHVSLLDGEGRNVFSADGGETRLRHAVGGLLSTMAEATLVFVNTVNGARRMAPGSYAPTRANWGENNRSVAVRLPAAPPAARRLEHLVAGADANPYLVLATVLSGMMEGMEGACEPGPALEGNAYDEATEHRGAPLPVTPRAQLAAFRDGSFGARALGPAMARHLAAIKDAEIGRLERTIPAAEYGAYL